MERPWIFLINPFTTATEDSYRAGKKIGEYTDAALAVHVGTPFFAGIYTAIHPLVVTFDSKYASWLGQQGGQKAQTSGYKAMLNELRSEKARQWDITIQGIYPEGSVQYINLLPRKRAPFQTGSQGDRMGALQAFSQKVALDPGLPPAMKTDVANFFAAISAQEDIQKGAVSSATGASDEVELAREALCVALYGALGLLMDHYKSNPGQVGQFFDLETIRNHEQSVFTGAVPAESRRKVMTHTFVSGEDVKLINDGPVPLQFALVADAQAEPTLSVTVQPNEDAMVDAEALGPIANRILIAINASGAQEGHYKVVLV